MPYCWSCARWNDKSFTHCVCGVQLVAGVVPDARRDQPGNHDEPSSAATQSEAKRPDDPARQPTPERERAMLAKAKRIVKVIEWADNAAMATDGDVPPTWEMMDTQQLRLFFRDAYRLAKWVVE